MSTSVIARKMASVPARTASDTWREIVHLIAAPGSSAEAELLSIIGVASMAIADEITAESPFIVQPSSGPRLRIYTVHGLDTEASETPLASLPTADDPWSLSIPSPADELDWVRGRLSGADHVSAHDASETPDSGNGDLRSESALVVDERWLEE